MTDDRMALKALVEKGSDAELLAEMLGFVAYRLMALDVRSFAFSYTYSPVTLERLSSTQKQGQER